MNNFFLQLTKELLILIIIGILYFIVTLSYFDFISDKYKLLLLGGLFFSVQYFRITLFERSVPWLQSFYIKLIIGVLNIPLFFYMLTNFMNTIRQFEDYNYTGIGYSVRDILPGLAGTDYSWLRSTTFFIGIAGMMLIVIMNFRLIYSVFKYRQGPIFSKRD